MLGRDSWICADLALLRSNTAQIYFCSINNNLLNKLNYMYMAKTKQSEIRVRLVQDNWPLTFNTRKKIYIMGSVILRNSFTTLTNNFI